MKRALAVEGGAEDEGEVAAKRRRVMHELGAFNLEAQALAREREAASKARIRHL